MRRLRFRAEAEADLAEAKSWYEARDPNLGADLIDAIDAVVRRAAAMPTQFPVVHRNVRRGLCRRFPYAVYFVTTDDETLVLAVLHQAVDARRWRGRR